MNDSPFYTKNEINRPSNVTTESRKGCRAAAFEFEEVVPVVGGEVDVGREDNGRDEEDEGNVGGTESEMVPESNVLEIELGCADSTEDGTGIEEVNSGTGFWNEPLI
jgi:hypothetical protein